jgi:membrane protease subunit (stomatin/prohibitin family)
MKKIVLNTYVVRNDNGIDVEATMRKFHSDVQALMSHEENDLAMISSAVKVVFDRYSAASINTDAVIHSALMEMQVGVECHQDMASKVRKYLQANSSDKREDNCLFRVAKGVGGGVCRWSEYIDKEKSTKK